MDVIAKTISRSFKDFTLLTSYKHINNNFTFKTIKQCVVSAADNDIFILPFVYCEFALFSGMLWFPWQRLHENNVQQTRTNAAAEASYDRVRSAALLTQ